MITKDDKKMMTKILTAATATAAVAEEERQVRYGVPVPVAGPAWWHSTVLILL